MDIAETIKFFDICLMLEKLKKTKTETGKIKYLRRYYESFLKHRERYRRLMNITEDEAGSTSFFCVLRCVIPRADRSREPYGLQMASLGKVYIKVLQLSMDSEEARRLQGNNYSGIRGDYADLVYMILKPRCKSEASKLNMRQVHCMLDTIARDDRHTEEELTALYESASAIEQKWFIRLLLKSMHLGLRETNVFAMLHPLAKNVYQRCSDLFRLCYLLANNKVEPCDEKPEEPKTVVPDRSLGFRDTVMPFQHVRPMLCEIFPGNIETILSADVLYMETKMDGERFQMHYIDDRFMYLSRNGIDYSLTFGVDYSCGTLTPKLKNLLPIGMESIIVDGEMMVWDPCTQRFRVKAEQIDVKHLKPIHSEDTNESGSWRPCFVLFDLLFWNGQSLLDLPFIQRSYKLRELFKEKLGVLHIMKPKKISSKEDFRHLFQEALDGNEEGVVIKKQSACYRPGTRNGGGWYKVKADYIQGLTTEFDLLVMGGFYNPSHSYIKAYLLGVLKYVSPLEYHVHSVGKVHNILLKREALNATLRENWHDMIMEPPPLWYCYRDNPEGRPDVWIDPKKSEILQIRAADLTPSSAFMMKKSLHFPRIIGWRNDKVWNECLTFDEFQKMCETTKGVLKITKRELRLEDFTQVRKRAKITPAQSRKQGALAYESNINPQEIARSSELLDGFSFCVLSTKADGIHSITDLKRLIVSHGGGIVENPLSTDPTCICIAGDITYRVERLQMAKRYNIVSISWLLKVCEQQVMKLSPHDMIGMTDDLRTQFKENFDEYGDSYTEHVRVSELENILKFLDANKKVLNASYLSLQEVGDLEQELFEYQSPNYFRNIRAYFYDATHPRVNTAKLIFQWRGGIKCTNLCTENLLEKIEYIFIDTASVDLNAFILWLQQFKSSISVEIVNTNWIFDSELEKQKLNVNYYLWNKNTEV